MFLKRRDWIAWVLLFAAALGWTYGLKFTRANVSSPSETTWPAADATIVPTGEPLFPTTVPAGEGETQTQNTEETAVPSTNTFPPGGYEEVKPNRGLRMLGYFLCIAAFSSGAIGIFFLRQKVPVLGPDGVCMIAAAFMLLCYGFLNLEYILWSIGYDFWVATGRFFAVLLLLIAVKELWGWIIAKASLSWCAISRIAKRCPTPQLSLLISVLWIVLALVCSAYTVLCYRHYRLCWIPIGGFAASVILSLLCLWKYGADLNHFKKQLSNYQQGLPIAVGDGAFSQTEAQLLDVQAKHEEAVKKAVTSERFKVELISNVSHDLRTPLTSILGYGELLQKEVLTEEGREQLSRLNQKAGYMRELVDSLFELTKVSSGVLESKQEKIDLIRLLEQTIGLFDDQLASAGLEVRRHYEIGSVPIVTDGARMHQVFANLLGNAMKYALTGTRIHLEVKEAGDSYRNRMINTASYEMDFDPEEILQRFARGDKARSTRGSGLGLAIAQTYTQSVGGSFSVAVDGDQFSAIVLLPKN